MAQPPRLYRRANHKVFGGVAGGIADHLRISPARVRIIFVLLALADGLGVVLYGAYWIVLSTAPGSPRRSRLDWLAYLGATVVSIVGMFTVARSTPLGNLFVPSTPAVLAVHSSGGRRVRRSASAGGGCCSSLGGSRLGRIRLALGAALVIAGGAVVLARSDLTAMRDGLVAVAVTVIGLALLTGPWWMRMVADSARNAASASAPRSGPILPRTCTTRCCRRSP